MFVTEFNYNPTENQAKAAHWALISLPQEPFPRAGKHVEETLILQDLKLPRQPRRPEVGPGFHFFPGPIQCLFLDFLFHSRLASSSFFSSLCHMKHRNKCAPPCWTYRCGWTKSMRKILAGLGLADTAWEDSLRHMHGCLWSLLTWKMTGFITTWELSLLGNDGFT